MPDTAPRLLDMFELYHRLMFSRDRVQSVVLLKIEICQLFLV